MSAAAPGRLAGHYPLVYPGLMLGVFYVVPFGIMVAVSFFHRVEGGFYEPAFELANYANFLQPLFLNSLAFSVMIAALSAAVCVAVGFPFTVFLARSPRRFQVPVIVLLLCVLTLSEVLMGFAWSMLLSRTAGVSNALAAIGLLDHPVSWFPGFVAVLLGLVYFAFPYSIFLMYPSVARLDPALAEAAQTLGASPARTFFTVLVPVLRPTIIAALVLVFVFTLGAYIIPQLLGRPQHWTLSVLITDQAVYKANLPFGAAMSLFLMVVSLTLVGLTLTFAKGRWAR